MTIPMRTQHVVPREMWTPVVSSQSQSVSTSPTLPDIPISTGIEVTTSEISLTQDQISVDEGDDPKIMLKNLKAKNRDRPIIAHLNINFLDPKFS